jgi:MFS family permease
VRTERAGVPSSRTALSDADARLGAMTWAHMVNDGAANYFPGILPAILADAHEPLSLAGSLVAAMAIGQALQPLVGWISDRVGGRAIHKPSPASDASPRAAEDFGPRSSWSAASWGGDSGRHWPAWSSCTSASATSGSSGSPVR